MHPGVFVGGGRPIVKDAPDKVQELLCRERDAHAVVESRRLGGYYVYSINRDVEDNRTSTDLGELEVGRRAYFAPDTLHDIDLRLADAVRATMGFAEFLGI
jgi:hypothetical protein